ncbi:MULTISPECIES: GDSL-type esterase/lipase family protein [Acidiphilium]|uniref:GDSL-like Lipase/Acylhydrolase family protein n=1 Tax=Acidiphilium rubrum TaxID=526 RepID=A0A8G2CM33_ACIRU|nr:MULTISPECIES: GDSL-type esterase/lipase family protein [Acidiphilium]SIR15561.1 GDSL-like Lipase/Acylhydrolase family protein [Acidiphilium rubrum]
MLNRLLLVFALLAAPGIAAARVNLAAAPIGRMDLPWWRAGFEATLAQARTDRNAQLVWLGDSITYYWQRTGAAPFEQIKPIWQRYYGRYHPLDFGLIGDTTSSVIWRIDHGEFNGLHPKLVIVLIGANNLGATHWGAHLTVPGIKAVVADLHRHVPHAKILLLGVLPSIRSAWISAETVKINRDLAQIYQHNTLVTFRNVGAVLEHDGKPEASLYVDPRLQPPQPPLHPDATGMQRIAAALAPTVAVLMK